MFFTLMNTNLNDAIVIALISFISSFIIQLIFRRLDRSKNIDTIQIALITEIEATLYIIKKRDYLNFLKNLTHNFKQDTPIEININIQSDYCPIFKSNLDKIGLLNKNLVSNIVIFHTTISCLLSEIHIDKDKNISTLKISNSEHLKETIELLELVIKIGNTITETTKNPR